MQLRAVDVSAELRVTYSNGGVEQWDKIISLCTNASRCTIMPAFIDVHFFQLINGALMGRNIQDDVVVQNQWLADGDGTTTTTLANLATLPVKPNSVTITATVGSVTTTVTDDGAGNLTGAGTEAGTVDYATGAVSVTWDASTDSGASILGDYTRGLATDDALTSGFSFKFTDDVTPSLTRLADFESIVPGISASTTSVDKYLMDEYNHYEVVMTATYVGAATNAITGVSIHYDALTGTAAGTALSSSTMLKSIAPMDNSVYAASELILANECNIELTYRVRAQA